MFYVHLFCLCGELCVVYVRTSCKIPSGWWVILLKYVLIKKILFYNQLQGLYQSLLTNKKLFLKSEFLVTWKKWQLRFNERKCIFWIQHSFMLLTITSNELDTKFWYSVWRRKRIFLVNNINKVTNGGTTGVNINTWTRVPILSMNTEDFPFEQTVYRILYNDVFFAFSMNETTFS